MKKTNIAYLLTIVSLTIAVAVPAVSRAENLVETEVTTGVSATVDGGSVSAQQNMRATLKAKIEADNAARNKTLRERLDDNNARKDIRPMASSTLIERKEIRDERKDETEDIRDGRRDDVRNASTSAERWGIRREALLEAFRARQTAFVKQLQLSIRNLEQISGRISERIVKLEQEGNDMTETKSLMVVATAKLDTAKVAVNAVASYTPPTASSTASSTVDLVKPRSIGDDATKAVREARDALKRVVESIIRVMGLNMNATSSATSSQ